MRCGYGDEGQGRGTVKTLDRACRERALVFEADGAVTRDLSRQRGGRWLEPWKVC